jgi:hypothetical protein
LPVYRPGGRSRARRCLMLAPGGLLTCWSATSPRPAGERERPGQRTDGAGAITTSGQRQRPQRADLDDAAGLALVAATPSTS